MAWQQKEKKKIMLIGYVEKPPHWEPGLHYPRALLSAKRYCAEFKHNMMTVQAGLGERQKNSQVGNSTVRQIQSRWIAQTTKERYHRKKILYHPNSILVQTFCLCPVRTRREFQYRFPKTLASILPFPPPYIKLSHVTCFRMSTYTCSSLEDTQSSQEKSLVSFNPARLSIILKSCVLILHRTESDSKSGMWGFKQFAWNHWIFPQEKSLKQCWFWTCPLCNIISKMLQTPCNSMVVVGYTLWYFS